MRLLLSTLAALFFGSSLYAAEIETPAKQAFVMDGKTGAVLLNKLGDERMAPSSMSKLMTLYMVFDRLKSGALTMDSTFPVSEKAWRKGGSKMFVNVNDNIKIGDLIRGIIVQSGNDACIVVAEGIAGSEDAFANLMNNKAKELGLKDSNFANSTGWPDEQHYMSPRDLAVLSKRLVEDFPDYYPLFAEASFTYSGITQPNRNRLLDDGIGVDGLKTGHTEIAGYGIAVSADKDDRRTYVVVNGLDSDTARQQSARALLVWAQNNFENRPVVIAGTKVASLPVAMGEAEEVNATVAEEVVATLPIGAELTSVVNANLPLEAPIAKGAEIGTLIVHVSDSYSVELPLIAAEAVDALPYWQRIVPNIRRLSSGEGS